MDFFEIKALAGTIVGGMLIVGAAFGVGPVSNDHWEPSNVIQLFSNDATSSNKTAGTPDNGTVQNLSDRAANSHPPETGGTGGDAADEADDEQPAPSGGQRVVATPQPTRTPGPQSVAGSTDHNDDDISGDPGGHEPDDQDDDGEGDDDDDDSGGSPGPAETPFPPAPAPPTAAPPTPGDSDDDDDDDDDDAAGMPSGPDGPPAAPVAPTPAPETGADDEDDDDDDDDDDDRGADDDD